MYEGKGYDSPKSYNLQPEDAIAVADEGIESLSGMKISKKAFIAVTYFNNPGYDITDYYFIIIDDSSNKKWKDSKENGRFGCEVDAITGKLVSIQNSSNQYDEEKEASGKKKVEFSSKELKSLTESSKKGAKSFLEQWGYNMDGFTFSKIVPYKDDSQCSMHVIYTNADKTIDVGIYMKGKRNQIVKVDVKLY